MSLEMLRAEVESCISKNVKRVVAESTCIKRVYCSSSNEDECRCAEVFLSMVSNGDSLQRSYFYGFNRFLMIRTEWYLCINSLYLNKDEDALYVSCSTFVSSTGNKIEVLLPLSSVTGYMVSSRGVIVFDEKKWNRSEGEVGKITVLSEKELDLIKKVKRYIEEMPNAVLKGDEGTIGVIKGFSRNRVQVAMKKGVEEFTLTVFRRRLFGDEKKGKRLIKFFITEEAYKGLGDLEEGKLKGLILDSFSSGLIERLPTVKERLFSDVIDKWMSKAYIG